MNSKNTSLKSKYHKMEQEDLVATCQSGDMLAVEELVKREQRLVFSTIYHSLSDKSDVADLTQEALFRMCKSIKSLRNVKHFRWWLNQIINNLIYDSLRKKKRRLSTVSIDETITLDAEKNNIPREVKDTGQKPEEISLNTELDTHIRAAIENLPEQFRTAIVLREIQGLTYEEIASITETTIGTVKSRIARARSRLQKDLKSYLEAE